jgi:hypothetical protein
MGDGEDPHKIPGALGLIAALVLLGWLALASTAAKIMDTTFYGEAALGREFTFRTVAGIALYLVLYGTIGARFGLTLASRGVGLGWYYLSFAILWRNINPPTPLYTHSGLWRGLATCRPIVNRPRS